MEKIKNLWGGMMNKYQKAWLTVSALSHTSINFKCYRDEMDIQLIQQLVEKHFELLEELERLKEQNSILNTKVIENNLKEMNYLMEKQDE